MFNVAYWSKKKKQTKNWTGKTHKYLKSAGHHKKHTTGKWEISQAFLKEKILLIL